MRSRAPSEVRDVAGWFLDGLNATTPEAALADRDLLSPFLSARRLERIREVLAARTDRLLLVLDDLYDSHNFSAICRTTEAFGLQHVLLTGQAPEGMNPQVARGSHHWLTVRREPDAARALCALRASGFTVAAAVLDEGAMSPETFAPSGPVALVMGNEHSGLGAPWTEESDVRLRIPLCGFSQSLNVSVAAGVLISSLLSKPALSSRGLPREEEEALSAAWVRRSAPRAAEILARLDRNGRGERDRGHRKP